MKPESILKLEKKLGVEIGLLQVGDVLDEENKNTYSLDEKKDIIELNLRGDKISDISFLIDFKELVSLDISYNFVKEISVLSNLTHLKVLSIRGNKIVDIKDLIKVKELEVLYLSYNQISDISSLQYLKKLSELHLSGNLIKDFTGLHKNKKLTNLEISNVGISDFSFLKDLKSLTYLNLSSNKIDDFSFIDNLKKLVSLNLSGNHITDISILKGLLSIETLDLKYNKIVEISFLSNFKKISSLEMGYNKIKDISSLNFLKELQTLDIDYNRIEVLPSLVDLQKLHYLNLNGNNISDLTPLKDLQNLTSLHVNSNNLINADALVFLKKLSRLDLSYNPNLSIAFLKNLFELKYLNLGHNQISDILVIKNLKELVNLDLNGNKIRNISSLENLKKLTTLRLSNNLITDITSLKNLNRLKRIELVDNPIKTTITDFNDFDAVKGYLKSLKQKADLLVENLDVKINILGAGRIGKTQLFNWLLEKPFKVNNKITHGTGVGVYNLNDTPYKSTLWDFGGQSYQHGTHSLFLRPKDFYIVLYRSINDDYSYGYWLGAARTFASDKINGKYTIPLFLIQSIWSEENDELIYPESKKITTYQVSPDHIFTIDVKKMNSKTDDWSLKGNYFLAILNNKIIEYAKSFGLIPKKFIEVKEQIIDQPFKDVFIKKDVFKSKFALNYNREDFAYLLQYLEFTGVIIYFREKKSLQEYIFTNPQGLSDWIYQTVLNKTFLKNNQGVLDYNKLVQKFGNEKARIFKDLMTDFNLLFDEPKSDENGINKFLVIPQFLPENNISFKKVLLELIPFNFSIKFEDFLYEGRIFNFISEYGQFAEDKTSYWKFGILFRYNDIQTIVFYDKEKRVINVHLEKKKSYELLAQQILDYFIMKQDEIDYSASKFEQNDIKYLENANRSFNEYKDVSLKRKITIDKVIIGSQLSTNGENYIDIIDTLLSVDNEVKTALCVETKKSIKLDILTLRLLGMDDKKLRKVFISYSRNDIKYRDALKSHLSILERYNLIKSWSCEDIKSGKWNKQIQNELEEADIIVYMVSHHFMQSEYIMNEEVKKGIELVANDESKKIVCVLTGVCQWKNWKMLEDLYRHSHDENGKFSTMDLSQYQFLPYHQYKDEKGVAIREEIIALEQWGRYPYDVENVAYNQIADKIFFETIN